MIWSNLGLSDWADEPWRGLHRLQEEMNHWFAGFEGAAENFPPLNVWSNREQIVVAAAAPGMKSEDLQVQVSGNLLTLAGERKAEEPAGETVCLRRERSGGRFARTVELPYPVDPAKVEARYEKGVLTVTLPRAEEDKPRVIKVS